MALEACKYENYLLSTCTCIQAKMLVSKSVQFQTCRLHANPLLEVCCNCSVACMFSFAALMQTSEHVTREPELMVTDFAVLSNCSDLISPARQSTADAMLHLVCFGQVCHNFTLSYLMSLHPLEGIRIYCDNLSDGSTTLARHHTYVMSAGALQTFTGGTIISRGRNPS